MERARYVGRREDDGVGAFSCTGEIVGIGVAALFPTLQNFRLFGLKIVWLKKDRRGFRRLHTNIVADVASQYTFAVTKSFEISGTSLPNGPENETSEEKKIAETLVQFGHLQMGTQISPLQQAAGLSTIQRLCEEIELARGTDKPLTQHVFWDALDYDLKNLSRLRIAGFEIKERNMRGYDLSDSNLENTKFWKVDFSDATLSGAKLDYTNFRRSFLYRAGLSQIHTGGSMKDLTEGAVQLATDDIWDLEKLPRSEQSVGVCEGAEWYGEQVLGIENRHYPNLYRYGVVLFQEGKCLGYLKLDGEPSFLALRTVRNSRGDAVFWKSMAYALDPRLQYWLLDRGISQHRKNSWLRADVEKVMREVIVGNEPEFRFGRSNVRFMSDGKVFSRLGELVGQIEEGKEPFVDLARAA